MHWNPAVGLPLLIIGLIGLALLWLFGQPRKPRQGRRVKHDGGGDAEGMRNEPTFDGQALADGDADAWEDVTAAGKPEQGELDMDMRKELESLGATLSANHDGGGSSTEAVRPAAPVKVAPPSTLGRRPAGLPVDRIVSLFVAAREGNVFRGADLVVAMEKAGLEFGDMGIFHRLLDGKPEAGAVFSVANLVKPGNFDMNTVCDITVPGLSFFMVLPGPLPALDAWDMMLPTAQRLSELLDGRILDDQSNTMGRQRIAHIRDDLRNWDREHRRT